MPDEPKERLRERLHIAKPANFLLLLFFRYKMLCKKTWPNWVGMPKEGVKELFKVWCILWAANKSLSPSYCCHELIVPWLFLVEFEYQTNGIRLRKNQDLHKEPTNGKKRKRIVSCTIALLFLNWKCVAWSFCLKECFARASAIKGLWYTALSFHKPYGYPMLIRNSSGDMAVRMRQVLTRSWVGVPVAFALIQVVVLFLPCLCLIFCTSQTS